MNIILLVFWMLCVPFGIGLLPTSFLPSLSRRWHIPFALTAGYIITLGLFEIAASIATLLGLTMTLLSLVTSILLGLAAIMGVMLYIAKWRSGLWNDAEASYMNEEQIEEQHNEQQIEQAKEQQREQEDCIYKSENKYGWVSRCTNVVRKYSSMIVWCFFGILLLVQLVVIAFYATPNGDDAYYLGISLIADEQDVLGTIDPYSGFPTVIKARHALATFPLWYAYLARMSGIHTATIAHIPMAMMYLILGYLVYFQIAKSLVARKMIPYFMTWIAMLYLFGYTSAYAKEVYFLTRTWQGKAILGNLILPAILWLLLSMFQLYDRHQAITREYRVYLLLLVMLSFAGVFASIMTAFLGCVILGVYAILLWIRYKKMRLALCPLLATLPYLGIGLISVLI